MSLLPAVSKYVAPFRTTPIKHGTLRVALLLVGALCLAGRGVSAAEIEVKIVPSYRQGDIFVYISALDGFHRVKFVPMGCSFVAIDLDSGKHFPIWPRGSDCSKVPRISRLYFSSSDAGCRFTAEGLPEYTEVYVVCGNGEDHIAIGQRAEYFNPLGYVEVLCGGGNDHVVINRNALTKVMGSSGNDVIFGGSGPDNLFGSVGSDVVYGRDGDDELDGGENRDDVFPGPGRNKIDPGWRRERAFPKDFIDMTEGDNRWILHMNWYAEIGCYGSELVDMRGYKYSDFDYPIVAYHGGPKHNVWEEWPRTKALEEALKHQRKASAVAAGDLEIADPMEERLFWLSDLEPTSVGDSTNLALETLLSQYQSDADVDAAIFEHIVAVAQLSWEDAADAIELPLEVDGELWMIHGPGEFIALFATAEEWAEIVDTECFFDQIDYYSSVGPWVVEDSGPEMEFDWDLLNAGNPWQIDESRLERQYDEGSVIDDVPEVLLNVSADSAQTLSSGQQPVWNEIDEQLFFFWRL